MKLINGECLAEMDALISKKVVVDMILCDLPQGITMCDWDIPIPLEELWPRYQSIIKENGAIVLFGNEPFSSSLRLSNKKIYKYDWVWDKVKGTGFLNAKRQPMRNHENICVFYKNQCLYNPQKTYGHKLKKAFKKGLKRVEVYGATKDGCNYESTERYPRSIQVFSTDSQKTSIHPTQKPVSLVEYLIKTYTNEGQIVLDNCMGSGTTGIACLNLKRKFIGIEMDIEYFIKAKERILAHEKEVTLHD